jgi:hypothetical protein
VLLILYTLHSTVRTPSESCASRGAILTSRSRTVATYNNKAGLAGATKEEAASVQQWASCESTR